MRGLKFLFELKYAIIICRTLHGVRGLKSIGIVSYMVLDWSHSSRSAWIEILQSSDTEQDSEVALFTECVD